MLRRFLELGLLDREFVQAQAGSTFPDDLAAGRALFELGPTQDWTPHPLLEPGFAAGPWVGHWRAKRFTAMLDELTDPGFRAPTSPVFDPLGWARTHPDASDPDGPLLHFLRTAGPDTVLPVGDRHLGPAPSWGGHRAAALHRAAELQRQFASCDTNGAGEHVEVDWAQLRAELPNRVPGRASVLVPTFQDVHLTRAAVRAVLDDAADADVEIVVVDNGSDRSTSSALRATFDGAPRVRLHRVARNQHFAGGSNVAFAHSTGEHVVFLNNDTVAHPGWLPPLLAPLARPEVLGTQPLLLYADGTVQSAGTVFLVDGHVASPFLAGHPLEDALRDPGTDFDAVTAAALAMRARDVVELCGFDSVFVNGMEDVDLCLRAAQLRPGGSFQVVHDSVVTHLESRTPGRGAHVEENRRLFVDRWRPVLDRAAAGRARYAALGFEVDAVTGDSTGNPLPRPVLRRPAAAFRARSVEELPRSLRWAVNIAAHGGPVGSQWGDTHFAEALAAALTRLGQQPVILRHDSHRHPVRHLCDVSLTLRGLDRVVPQPGAVNVLWVISHPDLVSDAEIAEHNVVAAASSAWSRRTARRLDRPVHTLLQATDPGRFRPAAEPAAAYEALFVGGRPRARPRPVVTAALAAGAPLAVFGPGWGDELPAGVLRGDYLPNDQLPQAYRSSRVVLNDHWPDMAAHGFINNRLFDAVATGARVVSDRVDGIEELFGDAVRTFADPAELGRLLGPEHATAFPDRAQRLLVAERIRREHTFDARAAQLLDLVTAQLRARVTG